MPNPTTRATLFAYVLAQELGGRGETAGSENGMSQLRVRDLAAPEQVTLLK